MTTAAASQPAARKPSPHGPDAGQVREWRQVPLVRLRYDRRHGAFEIDAHAVTTWQRNHLVRLPHAERLDQAVVAAQELARQIQRTTELEFPAAAGSFRPPYTGVQPALALMQAESGAWYASALGRGEKDKGLPVIATRYLWWDQDYTGPRSVPQLSSVQGLHEDVRALVTNDRWMAVDRTAQKLQ